MGFVIFWLYLGISSFLLAFDGFLDGLNFFFFLSFFEWIFFDRGAGCGFGKARIDDDRQNLFHFLLWIMHEIEILRMSRYYATPDEDKIVVVLVTYVEI